LNRVIPSASPSSQAPARSPVLPEKFFRRAMSSQLERAIVLRQGHHRVRFAPPPAAIFTSPICARPCSLVADQAGGGEWLLRFDDLRHAPQPAACLRSPRRPGLVGLDWDARRSFQVSAARSTDAALRQVPLSSGQLHPCHCSGGCSPDLSAPHGGMRRPIQGLCPAPVPADWGTKDGRQPSWRLRRRRARLHLA